MKTIRMLRHDHALWTAALRSGKYIQAYGALHVTTEDGEKFCVLGTLQDVLWGMTEEATGLPSEHWLESQEIEFYQTSKDMNMEPFRYRCQDPELLTLPDGVHCTASELNDASVPFSTLADLIDQCVEFTD